jgi:hypothetical protein
VIFLWIGLAFFIGYAASERGRNGLGWWVLAIAISPLLAGLFLFASRNLALTEPVEGESRRCPKCDELVRWGATLCKHCRSELPRSPAPLPRARPPAPSSRQAGPPFI